MGKKINDDDPQWLQVLQKKQQMRSKKRRQILFRRLLLIILVTVAAAAVLYFAAGRGIKGGKAGQDSENTPGTAPDSFTAAGLDKESETQADGGSAGEPDAQADSGDAGEPDAQADGGSAGEPDTQADAGMTEGPETKTDEGKGQEDTSLDDTDAEEPDSAETLQYRELGYAWTEKTRTLGNGISSSHVVLIDSESKTVLARKDETDRIVPASMTKVLTLLTAVEHLGEEADLDDKFKITAEITDYCYLNECSSAGFAINEKVTVRDLLYGTILPSGADAAMGLAEYVAGSQKAFVEMMNAKLEELGLSKSAHFTNCVGIYDEDHYCTVLDMAVIMEAAVQNETCREVLSAHTYTTSKTKQHKEGILLSNWFLRRIEDKDTGGEVLCAKTGYVAEAGNCAVSYGSDTKDRIYICVTADAPGSWKCIYDHVKIYKRFSGRK